MLNQLPAVCFQLSDQRRRLHRRQPGRRFRREAGRHDRDERVAAPPRDQRDDRHQQPADRDGAVLRREELARCGRRGMARRVLPSLGLLHEQPHEERHRRGQQAEEEHIAPRHFRAAGEIHALHLIGDDRREEQPDRRSGVQERARFDAAMFRNDFGDHGRARRPLAADAERRDDAEEHERRHVRRERACRRADRIHHHRQQQRARPAQTIGDAAENDAADRPANEQQRGQDAGPLKRRGSRGGRAERNAEQHGHGVRRDVIEEKAVEDIEAPSQPGGKQHRPLVGIHIEQCPSGRSRHGVAALSSLDHEIPFRVR